MVATCGPVMCPFYLDGYFVPALFVAISIIVLAVLSKTSDKSEVVTENINSTESD
jgi:hypothetical protein